MVWRAARGHFPAIRITSLRPHWLSCWLSFLAKRPYYVGADMLNAKNTLSVKISQLPQIY